MPGKRPAPKSAKGKKAPSRPAVRKAVGHKPEPVRVRAAPGHARKSAAAPKKPVAAPPAAASAPPVELRKPLRVAPATPPPATATMITASRSAAHAGNADGDDGETIEPGSLLAGPRNVQPYIAKSGEQHMSKLQLVHIPLILTSWWSYLMGGGARSASHMTNATA